MSEPQATTDSTDDEIVERFRAEFPHEYFRTEKLRENTDGRLVTNDNAAVALVGPEVTQIGDLCSLDTTPASYVDTRTVNGDTWSQRCYAFRTDGDEDVPLSELNVEYVRTLANGVFSVPYDTLKRNAAVLAELPDGYEDHHDTKYGPPVVFDLPDEEMRAVVMPVTHP